MALVRLATTGVRYLRRPLRVQKLVAVSRLLCCGLTVSGLATRHGDPRTAFAVSAPSQLRLLVLSSDSAIVSELTLTLSQSRAPRSDSVEVRRKFDLTAQIGDSGRVLGLVSGDSAFYVRVLWKSGTESVLQYLLPSGRHLASLRLAPEQRDLATATPSERIIAFGVPAQSPTLGGTEVWGLGEWPLQVAARWSACAQPPSARTIGLGEDVLISCSDGEGVAITSVRFGKGAMVHAVAFDSLTVKHSGACGATTVPELSSTGTLLYVGCLGSKVLIEIDTVTWLRQKSWISSVTPDVVLIAPDHRHLATLQKHPAVLSLGALQGDPRHAAIVFLEGDTATSMIPCGGRYVLAASRKGSSSIIEAVDLVSMERVMRRQFPFTIDAMVVER